MNRMMSQNRRGAAMALMILLALTACSKEYPQFFDIAWDEEVKLDGGRIMAAHVKNTYERRKKNADEYDEINIQFRRKELSFERSPGQIYILKTRMPVSYLGQFSDKWYLVISGQGPYGNFPDEMPDRWGKDFTTREQRVAVLENEAFQPILWEHAPSELRTMNLMESVFWRDFVAWDGKKLTLNQKRFFDKTHPSPDQNEITRPIRMLTPSKDTK